MPEPSISTCQDVGMWQFFVRWWCSLVVFVTDVRCPCSGVWLLSKQPQTLTGDHSVERIPLPRILFDRNRNSKQESSEKFQDLDRDRDRHPTIPKKFIKHPLKHPCRYHESIVIHQNLIGHVHIPPKMSKSVRNFLWDILHTDTRTDMQTTAKT